MEKIPKYDKRKIKKTIPEDKKAKILSLKKKIYQNELNSQDIIDDNVNYNFKIIKIIIKNNIFNKIKSNIKIFY